MLRKFSPVINGFMKGIMLAIVLSLISALTLHFTSLSESTLPGLALAILLFSVFMGGWWAARQAGSHGLLNGTKVAFLFIVLSLIITIVFLPGHFTWLGCLFKLLPVLLVGAAGGMLGVATRN